jgi:hypothetical protein
MADASRGRSRIHDDFQPTRQAGPPDVPAEPYDPLRDFTVTSPPANRTPPPPPPRRQPPPIAFDEGLTSRHLAIALDHQVLGERARIAAAVKAAHVAGVHDGQRTGYVEGWRWGVACGVVLGGVVMSIAFNLGRLGFGGAIAYLAGLLR